MKRLAGLTEAVNPRSHRLPEYRQKRNELGRIVYEHNPDPPVAVEEDEEADEIVGPLDPVGTIPYAGNSADMGALYNPPMQVALRATRPRIFFLEELQYEAIRGLPDTNDV